MPYNKQRLLKNTHTHNSANETDANGTLRTILLRKINDTPLYEQTNFSTVMKPVIMFESFKIIQLTGNLKRNSCLFNFKTAISVWILQITQAQMGIILNIPKFSKCLLFVLTFGIISGIK